MPTTWNRFWHLLISRRSVRWGLGAIAILLVLGAAGVLTRSWLTSQSPRTPDSTRSKDPNQSSPREPVGSGLEAITLEVAQQQAVRLRTEPAYAGMMHEVLMAPGQIVPNENAYAYITPRASGIVRTVAAHIGQDVKAGQLLATIDSPVVAEARLGLATELQNLEIARTRAEWQSSITAPTIDLIDRLESGDSPRQIEREFENRSVGQNLEQLMTAYAKFRLADTMLRRSQSLRADNAISLEAHQQQTQAEFEAALATYQALRDRIGFETRLENARASQAQRKAETAVRVARERLRVLGVRPDGREPEVRDGQVVGVRPDGTLPVVEPPDESIASQSPEAILPESRGEGANHPPMARLQPTLTRLSATLFPEGEEFPGLLSPSSLWAKGWGEGLRI